MDVDDGEVAEEEHGDRHDEAGDLAKQGSDQGGGGPGVGRRGSADRKDALQHRQVQSSPGSSADQLMLKVDNWWSRTSGESRVHEEEDQGEGENERTGDG